MPANVTYEFEKAKEKYEIAKTPLEKLLALQEMLKTAPSHKGAENLRADITRKIARVKKEMEKQKEQAKKAGKGAGIAVRKEGAGQICIVGLPNSGKSTFLKALTNAEVEIADYPFTTKKPMVGMVELKGGKVQMVEIPALVEGSSQGKAMGVQLLSIVRNADVLVLMVNAKEELGILKKELVNANIRFNESRPKIEIKKSKFPGISIAGKKFLKLPEEEFTNFIKALGYHNASVLLKEPATLDKVAQALDEKIVYKKAVVVTRNPAIKGWLKKESKGKVLEFQKGFEEEKIALLKKEMFALLGKILVYTKRPGSEPDYNEPLVLDKDATVKDVAKVLHKDFAKNLKYVRVWGSAKFPGQRVARKYKLQDEDVIEIYA